MRNSNKRCRFTVPGSGGGDRCRRELNHQKRNLAHPTFHLPDCGQAVDDDENWIIDETWQKVIYAEIVASGERIDWE